jgi:hypothetical protein
MKQTSMTFNVPLAHNAQIQNVAKIATRPGKDIEELQAQFATMAKLLAEVANQCNGVTEALMTIANSVKFLAK